MWDSRLKHGSPVLVEDQKTSDRNAVQILKILTVELATAALQPSTSQ